MWIRQRVINDLFCNKKKKTQFNLEIDKWQRSRWDLNAILVANLNIFIAIMYSYERMLHVAASMNESKRLELHVKHTYIHTYPIN